MHEMAKRPEKDRRELFRATAQRMQIHEAIVEKDFWVCWTLDYLFQESPWSSHIAFKGGTSLSKAFGAIERFSEDIDLVLDWRLLGYAKDEAWAKRSATKQDAFCVEANQRTAEFLARSLVPILRPALAKRAGTELEIETCGQEVSIQYPRAFSMESIQPKILLEIGPLAEWLPNEEKMIRPYAADQFPQLFRRPQGIVRTIAAERTFWEKATILHREAHRDPDKSVPPRFSRHYYDLCRLSRLPIRDRALARLDLLGEVIRFKMRFYRCNWAKYEEAASGNLLLLPPKHHTVELKNDYQAMQAMLFGFTPSFEETMAELSSLEETIKKTRRME